MNSLIEQYPAVVAPLVVAATWLTVGALLGVLSGWFRLMVNFPNQSEQPLLRLNHQSGFMGLGVNMHSILTLSACPSGLQVGVMRVFGPFCRDFFVPWQAISITRKKSLWLGEATNLQFGSPSIGGLMIPAHVANRLARAATGRWPETGPFPVETHRETLRRLLSRWALITGGAALFFTLVPLAVAPAGVRPPIVLAILFPAIFFGVVTIVRYVHERT